MNLRDLWSSRALVAALLRWDHRVLRGQNRLTTEITNNTELEAREGNACRVLINGTGSIEAGPQTNGELTLSLVR